MENPNGEIIGQITGNMRVGAGYILAATACGIDDTTAKAWVEAAQKAKD